MRFFNFFLIISIYCSCQSDDNDMTIISTTDTILSTTQSRNLAIENITNLDELINETSGLINFNGKIITHNDSGGSPSLYEIDIFSGKVIRTVNITNAVNIDMEDIAQDNNYIYLSDIGNNSNTRENQTIYKISKSDFLSKENVIADKIRISYEEQFDYERSDKQTNFDAEAIVNVEDNLFLFTKNWGDLQTSVYKIPKEKGKYNLSRINSININGLVTGADYNSVKKTIILTGYKNFIPFIAELSNFSPNDPLDGKIIKKNLTLNGSSQIEGIAYNPDGTYFISAEKNSVFPAVLYKMTY